MAKIHTVTVHLPEKTVTNSDLQKEFPDSDMKSFEETVGVVSRRVAAKNETALDLAEKAARKAMEESGISDIGFILFCTQTPDYHAPGNAGILQHRLGLGKHTGAFDFNLGCSGYVYGLSVARGLIDTGMTGSVLLITADTFSRFIHPRDRVNRALFGDGAAATIITGDEGGIGEFIFGSDGSGSDHLIVPNGCARSPLNPEVQEFEYGTGNITDKNHFFMDGLEVFSFTARVVPKLVNETLEKNGLSMDDIDHFVFHQANEYMLKFLRKKLKADESRFYINLKHVGNTSGATIPIGLRELTDSGALKPGQKVLLAGYGIGLSWAGTVIYT
jgi:3-oxoacyl-[acyl-carrier-protein] synthase III